MRTVFLRTEDNFAVKTISCQSKHEMYSTAKFEFILTKIFAVE